MVNQLYHTWLRQLRQLRPAERVTRLRAMAWLLAGIYLSRSVHLARVAGKIPGLTQLPSRTRRLERFLDNPALRERDWYAPMARRWLHYLADTVGELRLVVDGTKIGWGHQLLLIAVAYRRRVIPLVWTWVPYIKGHSSATTQVALLAYLRQLIPLGVRVTLVGDSEFGSVEVLKQLDAWHWEYVLRQKSNHHVKCTARGTWQDFGSLIEHPGQSRWLGRAWLTEQWAYRTCLLAHWQSGEKEPWLLATNLASGREALTAYRRRMWVEETFGDLKKHGFDLESTHLQRFLHLSRLTLAVALLYVWLMSVGTHAIKRGQRHWVDRRERRDLSLFQIGLRLIERQVTNALNISISLCLL
jgi:hypothetical protein